MSRIKGVLTCICCGDIQENFSDLTEEKCYTCRYKTYNVKYNGSEFNYINDNIEARSTEEAKRIFQQKWDVAHIDLITAY